MKLRMSRGKQVILSSTLLLALAIAAAGLFVFPEDASACIICEGSKTVCSGCQPWGKKCTDYVLTGCYPNPGCTWQAVRTYLTGC